MHLLNCFLCFRTQHSTQNSLSFAAPTTFLSSQIFGELTSQAAFACRSNFFCCSAKVQCEAQLKISISKCTGKDVYQPTLNYVCSKRRSLFGSSSLNIACFQYQSQIEQCFVQKCAKYCDCPCYYCCHNIVLRWALQVHCLPQVPYKKKNASAAAPRARGVFSRRCENS